MKEITELASKEYSLEVINLLLKDTKIEHFNNILRLKYPTVYSYIKFFNNKTIAETIYNLINNVEYLTCKYGNKQKFISFNKGYSGFCDDIKCGCSSEVRLSKFNTTIKKKRIDSIIGKSEYINPLYSNFFKARAKFNNSKRFYEGFEDIESFDKTIPVLGFIEPEDFKQRLLYYNTKLTSQKRCPVCNKIIHIKNNFCSAICSSKNYNFNPYIDKVNINCNKDGTTIISDINLNIRNIVIKCTCGKEQIHNRQVIGTTNHTTLCYDCRPKNTYFNSKPEKEIKEMFPMFKHEKRILGQKDIDLLYNNIGIEYNGLMWHSHGISTSSRFNKPKSNKNKHLIKTDMAYEKGIKLFHIFENEYIDEIKKNIWFSIIRNELELNIIIDASDCYVREISQEETFIFLSKNCLEGYIDYDISVGLFYEQTLVFAMVFNKDNGLYNLLRISSLNNYNIIDASLTVISYFENKFKPKAIITYANRRFINHKIYSVMGFDFINNTEPNSYYFHKNNLIKIYDEFYFNSSELFLYNNGFRKFYDSGSAIYYKEIKTRK